MPSRPQPWLILGLRFCGSCAITLIFWCIWLGLGASLVGLTYVAVQHELPVPGFVLRRAEANLEKAGLEIKFGHVRFDPSGKVLLEDVQLRAHQFEEPLLTCRILYVRRDFWSILAGRPIPDEIRLEGAVLQQPAMLSPSGTAEAMISDLTVVLRHQGNRWLLDQFSGLIGPVIVTAHGELANPAQSRDAAPLNPAELINDYLQISRRLAIELHHLDAFVEPSLNLQFESQEGIGNTVEVFFTAAAANQPWGQPVTLGSLAATTSLRLAGTSVRPLRVHAAIRNLNFRGQVELENVRAILAAEVDPGAVALKPLEAQVAAAAVQAQGEAVMGPVLHADLSHWPDIKTSFMGNISGEVLTAEVDAQLIARSAVIRAEGRAAPDIINRVLAKQTPRAAPFFVFGDPLSFQAEAVLGPDWHFQTLSARTAAGRIDSHGVKLTSARGRIDIVGTSFLAHDAQASLGGSIARGSYWMDFATSEYRMLLDGRLRPPQINGWFHNDWWLNFWGKNFAFNATPPEAEVDVQGFWRDPSHTLFFGQASAKGVRVWGGDFENVQATVFLRPNFTHAFDIAASRAGGAQQIHGSFKRFTDDTKQETNKLEFNFDTSVDTATLAPMLGGKIDDLLASLHFNHAPRVHADGALTGQFPGAKPDYTFNGQTEGGLSYFGFPLESAQVSGQVSGDDILLNEIEFSAAGGHGTGKASVTGSPETRRLGFDIHLSQADLARTIRAMEEFEGARTGQRVVSGADSKFMKRVSGGRLDLAVAAEGKPGEIASFTGSGNASVAGVELGEIHLFGLLSQVLSGLALNFSSLKLDNAKTSFRMENGRLSFPDLRVSGPSAVIDARGNFAFATEGLDFTAKLKPFKESRSLLTTVVGVVINPIASILELKLNGPISNPNWSIEVGQSGAHPENPALDNKTAPAAPAAPIPAAAPIKPGPPTK